METIHYEVRQQGDLWELKRNGSLLVVSLQRSATINAIAGYHRRELRSESIEHFRLTGLTLGELLNSPVLDINWRRKGPPIELARFEDAESHLECLLPSPATARAKLRYEVAMQNEDFGSALDQLIVIGNLSEVPPKYWTVLKLIAGSVWSFVQNIPNRKERGEVQTKIELIERRLRGDREWNPKLALIEE